MRCRYAVFLSTITTLKIFCYSYITTFCGIYKESSNGWIIGVIVNMVTDMFIIFTTVSIIKATLRMIIRKFPSCKCLVKVEELMGLMDFM